MIKIKGIGFHAEIVELTLEEIINKNKEKCEESISANGGLITAEDDVYYTAWLRESERKIK